MEHNGKPRTRPTQIGPIDSWQSCQSTLRLRDFIHPMTLSRESKSESSQETENIPLIWRRKLNTKKYTEEGKGKSLFKKVKENSEIWLSVVTTGNSYYTRAEGKMNKEGA